MKSAKWIFVIDTEEYAGNFERELTAYVTGHVGECGVGEELQQLYRNETNDVHSTKFEELLEYRPDEDNGCRRPCAIHPTPGWFNHGMGEHFRDGQEIEALKSYFNVISEYYGKKIAERQAIKTTLESGGTHANWTVKDCDREIAHSQRDMNVELALTKVKKYPAYMSVAIYFEKKPAQDIIDLMKERANGFAAAKRKFATETGQTWDADFDITITGFRLIKESTKEDAIAV